MSPRDFCQDRCPEGCRGARVIYLSGASLCFGTRAAYPPAMDEQPIVAVTGNRSDLQRAGIHGLATHKTCGIPCRHGTRWALTPPFHHCLKPSEGLTGCYFLSRYSAVADSSLLESMVLCVARTFLMPLRRSTSIGKRHKRPATVGAKLQIIFKTVAIAADLLYFYTFLYIFLS